MDRRTARLLPFLIPALVLSLFAAACGDDEEESGLCKGAEIYPHLSPLSFGEVWPTPGDDADVDPGDPERTPIEFTLLFQAPCDTAVAIQEVCLVGDAADQFTLEGPVPETATRGTEAAVRISYLREAPTDANSDGAPDVDQIALVVQSNAQNFPTLVVPVCGSVIADGAERKPIVCESPVTVEEGTRDEALCP